MGDNFAIKYRKNHQTRPGLFILALIVFISILFYSTVASAVVDVTLAWDASSGADGYRLFYRQDGQGYNYATPDWEGSGTTCTIYGLDDLTTYHFVVRAYNADDESGDSNEETLSPASNPVISLSTTSLANSSTEGTNAPSQTFKVWNSGGGTLSYSISDNRSWLSVTPSSGTSTGGQDTITVNYNTSGLSPGTRNATITISDPNADNDPQTISVSLTVDALPSSISLSTSSLSNSCTEGTDAPSQTFQVSNSGGGSLNYSISDNRSWLSVSPSSGTSTGEQDTITVNYNTSGLTARTRNATITISDPNADNDPQTITVSLTVNAANNQSPTASFTATPTSGDTPLDVSFNASGSTDPDGSIVSYSWNFGDGDTETDVSPSHTYASAGNYTAILTVTDNDGATDSSSNLIQVTEPPASNLPPNQPVIASPYQGEMETDLLLSLETEPFSDPDGDVHNESHWQISKQEDFSTSTTVVLGDVPEADYTGTSQDTFINSGQPTTNYSTGSSLNTYTWPANTAANRTIMNWDLSAIPPNATITDATLSLYMNGYNGTGGDDNYEISAHKIVNHDPVISACTWNTFDDVSSWTGGADGGAQDLAAPESTTVVAKTVGYKDWNITQMVQKWANDPSSNFGLMLDADSTAASDSNRYFSSSEYADSNQRPKLTITYTLADGSDLVFDITSNENLTELTVPDNVLEPETTYYVRVQFYDANSMASEWAEPIQFTTASGAPVLSSLSINSPDALDENTTASYIAIASYYDGSTQEVTGSCTWTDDSDYASIDSSGLLTATEVSGDQTVTITASYTFGDVTETATKVVTIVDVPDLNLPPFKPVISSPYYGQMEYDLVAHITAEPFSDPNEGDYHSQSRWQISKQEDFFTSTTVVLGDVPEADYTGTSQDTFINSGQAAKNYSVASSLRTYTWPANTAANRTIIKWDLSAIPPDATIKDATLSLYMHRYSGTGGDDVYEISAHKIINNGPIISSCTWNTYDGVNSWTGGSDMGAQDMAPAESTNIVDKTVGYKDWDVTQMVQDWVYDPSSNFGLMLDADSTAASDSNRYFRSSEYADSNQRPKLTITYTLADDSDLVLDTTSSENLTELTVPAGVLEPSSTYYVRVQFYDGSLEPSEWSEAIEFMTISAFHDSDNDGILDVDEIIIYGTDPNKRDTDYDGINDGDELAYWGDDWNADHDGDGLINLRDPDADGDGFPDGAEIEYGFDPSDADSRPEFPPLEIGEVSVDHNWKRVEFSNSFLAPVVVAKPLSFNDADPAVARIRNVNGTGFEIRIQEWDYLDGVHAEETVSYLVMERGTYTLVDGTQIEAGRFDTNKTDSYEEVTFNHTFQEVPVVVAAVSTFNGADTVTSRLSNISTQGFEFRMQEQELNAQSHKTETISYVAWEPCSGLMDGLTFEVYRTQDVMDHDFQTIQFDQPFQSIPMFLGDMQTTNGGDAANVRWQNKDLYGVDVQINEEQSSDTETNHVTEVVGYLVFGHNDADSDGITDYDEMTIYGTDPNRRNTDYDGIKDGEELAYWGDDWDTDYDGDGLINLLDQDADNDGFSDGAELKYGFAPADPDSRPLVPPLEIGEVRVDHNWKQVKFSESFLTPVVVAKPLSNNEADPAVVRIRNLKRTGFEIRIQEWDYLDGVHIEEVVSYLVMERGSYTLADGTLVEARRFGTDKVDLFRTVNFKQPFEEVPVVVASVFTCNEEDAVTGRLRNIDTQGFEFSMQEQELNEQVHAKETISYIAWEPSVGDLDVLSFEVNRTQDVIRHEWQIVSFSQSFANSPVFVADIQTADGENTANLRCQNRDLDGIDVLIQEEQSMDTETNHTTEVVGYMVFDDQ